MINYAKISGSSHEALAICYTMKEEMSKLYAITDYEKAVEG